MVTQPAYVRVLKEYTRAMYGTKEDTAAVADDLENESDRGVVILSATGVEDILEWKMRQMMPALQTDKVADDFLFGQNGSAGTFSSKIYLAFALGIIDLDGRKEIDLIREMRNACAHSRKPISFERPELQGICKAVLGDVFLAEIIDHSPRTLRLAFISKCAMVQAYIITGKRFTIHEMPASAADL